MTELATILTAATALVVGLGGLLINRAGIRRQIQQEQAAGLVAKQALDLDVVNDANEVLQKLNDRLMLISDRDSERIAILEHTLDEERSLRRAMLSAQESSCREIQAQLTEALIVLRGVVTDEITKASVDVVLELPTHPHS